MRLGGRSRNGIHSLAIHAATILVLSAVIAYPVATAFNRAAAIALGIFFIAQTGLLVRRSKTALAIFSLCAISPVAFLLAPGRPLDSRQLAERYRVELLRYQGTRYVWGGENRLGIDCSGLVRIALVNAMLRQGIATANPALVRSGLSLWWHDKSALSLRDGGDGTTIPITSADSINAIDCSEIHLGDLAVTASGVHVMAYAGDHLWVEADPNRHRVIAAVAPVPNNSWFATKVRVMRWIVLR
jgi:hypothetical protein